VNKLDASPLVVFNLSQGMFGAAIVFGSPTVNLIAQALHLGDLAWVSVAIVLVFIILTLAAFLTNQREINRFWGLAGQSLESEDTEANESLKLGFLVEHCKLTPREYEVAKLLAKGRSLPFIQESLFISSGTAKTHLRHIYQKTNVHNRQEFLDYIDRNSKL
jgi:DNA-binding NarL/FixJ family response regulator